MLWPAQILVIAHESDDRWRLQKILEAAGTQVFCYSTLLEAQSFLSGQTVDAVFAETNLPDGDFQSVHAEVEHFQPDVPLIALSSKIDWNRSLVAMADGAFDYITLPVNPIAVNRALSAALSAITSDRHAETVASTPVKSIIRAV